MKTITEIRKEINPEIYYSPHQIAKANWIVNGACQKEKARYEYILKMIRLGKLSAKNFGLGKVPHYRIKGIDILSWLKIY